MDRVGEAVLRAIRVQLRLGRHGPAAGIRRPRKGGGRGRAPREEGQPQGGHLNSHTTQVHHVPSAAFNASRQPTPLLYMFKQV